MKPQRLHLTPKIYLSYSWADEAVANIIDDDWQKIGLRLIRDVRDVDYKASLKDFMRSMPSGDYVLILVSKGYLQSKNCMFESLELFKNPDFKNKILPIMVFSDEDKNIYDASGKLHYIKYWEDKADALNEEIRSVGSFDNIQSVYEEINHFKNIRNNIDEISGILSDMRTISWPDAKDKNYKDIFTYIGFLPDYSIMLSECDRIIRLDNAEQQETELEELETKFGNNEFISFTKASIAYGEQKYKKAKSALEFTLSINDNSTLAHNILGVMLHEKFNDPIRGRHHVEKALRINPNFGLAHYNLALILVDKEFSDYDRAKQHFIRAIELEPDFAKAYFNLAYLYRIHFRDNLNALKYYKLAVKFDPKDAVNHFGLAEIFTIYQDYTRAKKHYERALEINHSYAKAHVNLGNILAGYYDNTESLTDDSKALKHYEHAMHVEPNNFQAHIGLALFLKQRKNQVDDALKHYKIAFGLKAEIRNPELDKLFGLDTH